MATLIFKAFAGFNNALCEESAKGWFTLFTTPFVVGGLNIIIYLCILITALVLRYGAEENWQNSDGKGGGRSFPRALLFAVIDWYFILLLIALVYKLFFCKRTVGASRAYSRVAEVKKLTR